MSKTKNLNIVIIVISILIFCLIVMGIFSYINYGKNNLREYEILNIESDEVKKLVFLTRGSHKNHLFYGTNYYNIYYNGDSIKINQLNEDFKKLLAYYTLDISLIDNSNNNSVFNSEDLRKQYIAIFGNDSSYVDGDISCNCPSKIIYFPSKDQYILDGSYGRVVLEGYNNKIIEARKYNDKIEIYEKVVFYIKNEDTSVVTYYKDSEFKEKIITISGNEKFKFEDYDKQYDTYKYTFILKNELYYFDSVEKIK